MIVPSIDLMNGRAVQLEGGRGPALASADPIQKMKEFSPVGEVAVIDLDAALGVGSNAELVEKLCKLGRVRVGGGIRDVATARRWLDNGADRVIIGTSASETLLAGLPRERVIVSIDSRHDAVLSHGWQQETGTRLSDSIRRFSGICGGLLITFVEREGRLSGTDLRRARDVVALAGETPVTIAGGITSAAEIAALDEIGADAQVGMALYTGQLDLAEALTAPMKSERADGLWPTVVTDGHGVALGMAWSSVTSVRAALSSGRGVYHSRSRGIWVKGETSGAGQRLHSIDVDCDRDTLRFVVDQDDPGFCHLGHRTCWGEDRGIPRLSRRIHAIATEVPQDSNTTRLLREPSLLASKLVEEASELAVSSGSEEVSWEAADLLYFVLVKAVSAGVSLEEIAQILDSRELVVSKRPMVAKDQDR